MATTCEPPSSSPPEADISLKRVYGLLDGAALAELQALLPPQDEEEELEGLDIDDGEVDPDAALEKMQANLDSLEDKVSSGPRRSRALTSAAAQR